MFTVFHIVRTTGWSSITFIVLLSNLYHISPPEIDSFNNNTYNNIFLVLEIYEWDIGFCIFFINDVDNSLYTGEYTSGGFV